MERFRFVDGQFINAEFLCECGRRHSAPIQDIRIRPGAVNEVGDVLNGLDLGKHGLVVADLNTYEIAGDTVMNVLHQSGYNPRLCLFNTHDMILPDEYAMGKALFYLDPDIAFFISVGAGTLTDITRYVSFCTGRPFISVATAASMDGFASSVAPTLQDGYKRTVPASYPQAIIADLNILCGAPYPMTAAGFGDLLGKLISRLDWKLSQLVNGEYYCEYLVELVDEAVKSCIANAANIRNLEPLTIAKLMEGLTISGVGMIAVGNSRPAAGSEHLLSHFWEMKSLFEHRPHHFHGEKVGVATGVMAAFYQHFLSRDPANLDLQKVKQEKKSLDAWQAQIRECLGPVAEEVLRVRNSEYRPWDKQKQRIATIQREWEQIQALQEKVPTLESVVKIQREVQGSVMPGDIDVERAFLHDALLHAKDVRIVYSVLDVADTLGWLEEITEEVVNEYDFDK